MGLKYLVALEEKDIVDHYNEQSRLFRMAGMITMAEKVEADLDRIFQLRKHLRRSFYDLSPS